MYIVIYYFIKNINLLLLVNPYLNSNDKFSIKGVKMQNLNINTQSRIKIYNMQTKK